VEDTILLESTERFQITGSKYKKILLEDDRDYWPSKKAKGKQPARYYGDNGVKIGGANHCERCVCARQDCLVHNSR